MKMLIALFTLLLLLGCEDTKEVVEESIHVVEVSTFYEELTMVSKEPVEEVDDTIPSSIGGKPKYPDNIWLRNDSLIITTFGDILSDGSLINIVESDEELHSSLRKYDAFVIIGNYDNADVNAFGSFVPLDDSKYRWNHFVNVTPVITQSFTLSNGDVIVDLGDKLDTLSLNELGNYSDTVTITDHPDYSEIILEYHIRVKNSGPFSYDRVSLLPQE